jgi:cytochrome P450
VLDLGHLRPLFAEGPLDAYLRWAKQEQRDFVVQCGLAPRVVAIEPESIREVLAGEQFGRNTAATEHMFGRGLLRLDGQPWQQRRSLFAPAFRGEALAAVIAIVQDETDALIRSWHAHAGRSFRPARELSACMLRILARFLFGIELDMQRHGGAPLHRALVTLSTDAVMRHFLPGGLVSLRNARAVAQARAHLDGLCELLLREGRPTPFLQALREALASGEIDRATVIDELRTFLIAGHETSATALAWAVALLVEHRELAQPVRAEGERAARITSLVEFAELEHTQRFVKEVLRLYPAVPIASARALADVQLGRLELPRGTIVDVSSYVQHRLAWLWPEPERFDPSRFEQPPRYGSFLPFLLGPHTCIGQQLAMIELSVMLARLAASFTFELPDGPPRPNLRVSLHPAKLVLRARGL